MNRAELLRIRRERERRHYRRLNRRPLPSDDESSSDGARDGDEDSSDDSNHGKFHSIIFQPFPPDILISSFIKSNQPFVE